MTTGLDDRIPVNIMAHLFLLFLLLTSCSFSQGLLWIQLIWIEVYKKAGILSEKDLPASPG